MGHKDSLVSLLLCAEYNGKMPVGFFINSKSAVHIQEVDFSEAIVGYDIKGNIPLYAFDSTGRGIINGGVDFSFAENRFCLVYALPKIQIEYYKANSSTMNFHYGAEHFYILPSPVLKEITLQTAAFSSSYAKLTFDQNTNIASVLMRANYGDSFIPYYNNRILEPLETDLGFIQHWSTASWRNKSFELFRWNLFPQVLFFDFSSYSVQDKFFTRLAYFVEKKGYVGTLVDDDFVMSNGLFCVHLASLDRVLYFFCHTLLFQQVLLPCL